MSTEEKVADTLATVRGLNELALERGQTLAEMALAWNLRHDVVSSVLIVASKVSQLEKNLNALKQVTFSPEELQKIDQLTLN